MRAWPLLAICLVLGWSAQAEPLDPVRLGKALFFDPRLSADNSISCASCHDPRHAYASTPRGSRKAPTLLNVRFNSTFFWDGRAPTLEAQLTGPLLKEMGMGSMTAVAAKVGGLPEYGHCDVPRAIAAYERTLSSFDAPFDRYLGGDQHALSPSAVRGLNLFVGAGSCAMCHTVSGPAPLFTDFRFHNTGIGGAGRFRITGDPHDMGAFKTPTLRNIELTAPYMHDGSLPTLRAVLRYYNQGGHANASLDTSLDRLDLSASQLDDLEAFLRSLTGDSARRLSAPGKAPF